MMIGLSLALLVSLAVLAWLWHGDPKRRRVAGMSTGQGAAMRRALAAIAVAPGILLAASGDSAAFLIWLGGCAVGGWTITQLRSRSRRTE